ncbi:unnamed protein product [Lymnaea stagnalis]|uniref:Uncharacterized protein n=1 Tax=Lymnaea stagnalis TaxID=6523 RepID=A0AAV2I474_LYMST
MKSRTNDQEIIRREVDVNSKESKGWTALMFATTSGDIEIVQQLIETGANLNAQNEEGWTALMLAARHKHVDICKHLITKGASVNLTERHGLTALMISSIIGNKEIVKAITETSAATLEKGREKVGIKDTFKYNRVVKRVRNRKSLIDNESLKIAMGTIPLLSPSYIDETSCKEDDAAINDEIRCENVLQVPENTKAEKKYPDVKRYQPVKKGTVIDIINAATKGNIKMLDFLIGQGVNIDDKTEDGKTALMVLSLKGCTNGVELLLSKGANIDAVNDEKGLTALMFACHKGDFKTVELLIKEGANVKLLDKQGWNALMHAVANGYKDIAYLLTHCKQKEEEANIDTCPEKTQQNDCQCSDGLNLTGNHETGEQISVPIEQNEEVSSKSIANDFKLESVSEANEDASDVNV